MSLYLLDLGIPLINEQILYSPLVIESDLELDLELLMNQDADSLEPLVTFLSTHSPVFKGCYLRQHPDGFNQIVLPHGSAEQAYSMSFVNQIEDEQIDDLELVSPTWVSA